MKRPDTDADINAEAASDKVSSHSAITEAIKTVGLEVVDATPCTSAVTQSAPASEEATVGCPFHRIPPASEPATEGCPFHRIPPRPPAPLTDWPRVPPGSKLKVSRYDRTQENIDDLLAMHADDLRALRGKLGSEKLLSSEHDDIFLLRFLLSNKSVEKSEAPLRETLRWRKENAARLAQAAAWYRDPKHDAMGKMSIADLLDVTTLNDEPVLVVRSGRSDVRSLMDAYSQDEVVEYLNYAKERAFRMCDEATRRTRRLVKMITVLDCAQSKLSGNDSRFMKALGRSSKEAEVHYPQLLALTVPINTPPFMSLLWGIAKRFLPARTVAKLRVCGASNTSRQSVAECPFAARNFTPETLCTFLGGMMPPTSRLRLPGDE